VMRALRTPIPRSPPCGTRLGADDAKTSRR
jgi:hypothetical protein